MNVDRFMEKAIAGRWNERRWCPVWFTTWYGPFHMGMIPFNPPWGPARVSDDVYSVASLSSLVGNVLPFLRAIPWKKNTLISGYRRLCTLGSIHLSLYNPPVFATQRRVRRDGKFNAAFPIFVACETISRKNNHKSLFSTDISCKSICK